MAPRAIAHAALLPSDRITGAGQAFESQRFVAAEASTYHSDCQCSHQVDVTRAALHKSLHRVLVLDARFHWNGLGNSLPRWLGLLRVGNAMRRATFLWMDDDDADDDTVDEDGPEAPEPFSVRRATTPRFDIGRYFVSRAGADWRWSRRWDAAVSARHNVTAPTTRVRYRCARATHTCMEPRLEVEAATRGGALEWRVAVSATHETELAGRLLSWLRGLDSPWVELQLDGQVALEASSAAAGPELQHALCTSPADGWPLKDIRGWALTDAPRLTLQCEAVSLLQPRRWLQSRLLPFLTRLAEYDRVLGVHIRTGFADWQALSQHALAAARALPTLSRPAQWAAFEASLLDCTAASRRVGAPCFHWKSPHLDRAPSLLDGHACAASPDVGFRLRSPPSNGTLSAVVACASRLAEALRPTQARRRATSGATAEVGAAAAARAWESSGREPSWESANRDRPLQSPWVLQALTQPPQREDDADDASDAQPQGGSVGGTGAGSAAEVEAL